MELTPLLFSVAEAGDPIAREIVRRQADEVVALAATAIRRLDALSEPIDVVLGGGVLTAGTRIADGRDHPAAGRAGAARRRAGGRGTADPRRRAARPRPDRGRGRCSDAAAGVVLARRAVGRQPGLELAAPLHPGCLLTATRARAARAVSQQPRPASAPGHPGCLLTAARARAARAVSQQPRTASGAACTHTVCLLTAARARAEVPWRPRKRRHESCAMAVSRLAHIPGIGVNVMGDRADAAADPSMLRMENLDTDLRPPEVALERTRLAVDEDEANSYLPFEGHHELRAAAAAHVTRVSGRAYDAGHRVRERGRRAQRHPQRAAGDLRARLRGGAVRPDLRRTRQPGPAGRRGAGPCAGRSPPPTGGAPIPSDWPRQSGRTPRRCC